MYSDDIELWALIRIQAKRATTRQMQILKRESIDGEASDDQIFCGLPVCLPSAAMDCG
jgi:hypothetical protein